MDCIFCKVVKGELPSYKIYEDEALLALLDINPVNKGHVLVIPKKHLPTYEVIDEETLSKIFLLVKKVGLAIKLGLGVKGYNTTVNNGLIAGQIIPHFHVHIIPRCKNDGLSLWPQKKYREGEASFLCDKIKNKI